MAATAAVSKHTDAASAQAGAFRHYDGSPTLGDFYLKAL